MASKGKNTSTQETAPSKSKAKQTTVSDFSDGIESIANRGTEALSSCMEYYKDIDSKAIDALKEIGTSTDDVELKRECVDEIKQIHNDAYMVQDKQAERIIEKEKADFDCYIPLLGVSFFTVYLLANPDALKKLASYQANFSFDQFKALPTSLMSAFRIKR